MSTIAVKKRSVERDEARLNCRLSSEARSLIEKAAILSNQTLTDFTVSTLISRAEEIIERHHNIRLSAEASQRFLALLEKPPAPNAALKKALKRRQLRRR